ncbi:MAG: sulfurtransferase [Chloroflexota bacterium]|nr:sulfurtransferase [Chloroflexota bacterium]MDE2840836.1 sulfurtransferase [Chloroflexota bacterium]MDE2930474.1 sulfurtransferase [Chloroflexota bacterium]
MAEYADSDVLVSTDWVAQHGGDANVRLVEVDVDTTAYETGHIAGAVDWGWQSDLNDPVRRDLIGKEDLEELLGQSGITPDTTVVLYGDNNNWFAAFALWILKIYGHKDARLMNGGRVKWEAEDRPLTEDIPYVAQASYTAQDPDTALRVFQGDVQERLSNPNVGLVDVRSPQEFTGEILAPPGLPETAQRGGHIPGAANIPWASAVADDGTFKSPDELGEIYGGKGIVPDKEIVTYCRIGERSSHTWFVLKYLLGYPDVRNYDGSWTEWGSMIGVPIEK